MNALTAHSPLKDISEKERGSVGLGKGTGMGQLLEKNSTCESL